MIFAAIHAAAAEGALGRIVGPVEFLSRGGEGDSPRSASEAAHGATAAPRWIEAHKPAKALGHGRRSRITQGGDSTTQVVPEESDDLHDHNLMMSEEEMTMTASTTAHWP